MIEYRYEPGLNPRKTRSELYHENLESITQNFERQDKIFSQIMAIADRENISNEQMTMIYQAIQCLLNGYHSVACRLFRKHFASNDNIENLELMYMIFNSLCFGAIFEPERLKEGK